MLDSYVLSADEVNAKSHGEVAPFIKLVILVTAAAAVLEFTEAEVEPEVAVATLTLDVMYPCKAAVLPDVIAVFMSAVAVALGATFSVVVVVVLELVFDFAFS